jgi:putative PIG3 family NAD(P)H quinone oxidoreductase
MKAIVISRFGGPEVLELRDRDAPSPGRGEVRVRIRAAAVNRADLLQRAGSYPAPPDAPPDIPGLEFAGELEAAGDGVTGAAPGDRVLGLCGGGAYAETITVAARTVARLPDALTFTDGAAIPEAFITAWDALIEQAHLLAGETLLIHAVGSGVGTAAAQVAHAVGARVIGTARTADKLARARQLGLDEGVLVERHGGFAPAVLRATGGRGVDVVLDLVGGPYMAENLTCVAPRARIVQVGLLAGSLAELDLGRLMQRRVQLIGTVLRARPLEEKIAAVQQMAHHLLPLFERGALRSVVDRVFPLAEAAAAHAHVASNSGFGKVVLAVA